MIRCPSWRVYESSRIRMMFTLSDNAASSTPTTAITHKKAGALRGTRGAGCGKGESGVTRSSPELRGVSSNGSVCFFHRSSTSSENRDQRSAVSESAKRRKANRRVSEKASHFTFIRSHLRTFRTFSRSHVRTFAPSHVHTWTHFHVLTFSHPSGIRRVPPPASADSTPGQ